MNELDKLINYHKYQATLCEPGMSQDNPQHGEWHHICAVALRTLRPLAEAEAARDAAQREFFDAIESFQTPEHVIESATVALRFAVHALSLARDAAYKALHERDESQGHNE